MAYHRLMEASKGCWLIDWLSNVGEKIPPMGLPILVGNKAHLSNDSQPWDLTLRTHSVVYTTLNQCYRN